MRTKKYSLAVTLALMSLAIPGPAQATAVDYFLSFGDIKGESSDKHSDGILTFSINDAGLMIAASLTLTGPVASGPYSVISSQGPDTAVSPSLYTVTLSDGHSDSLFLAFPVVTLSGFTGPLCGKQSGSCGVTPVNGIAGFQLVSQLFINGDTTPTAVLITGTPTPEPSSLLLLGSGLLGFGTLIRRRIRFGATN